MDTLAIGDKKVKRDIDISASKETQGKSNKISIVFTGYLVMGHTAKVKAKESILC